MTNSKSELFEKHPEWVIQQPHREMHKGRGGTQLVLDLSNPEVQEFVFGVVDKLMTEHPEIAYIKWDANMTLFNYGSTTCPATNSRTSTSPTTAAWKTSSSVSMPSTRIW